MQPRSLISVACLLLSILHKCNTPSVLWYSILYQQCSNEYNSQFKQFTTWKFPMCSTWSEGDNMSYTYQAEDRAKFLNLGKFGSILHLIGAWQIISAAAGHTGNSTFVQCYSVAGVGPTQPKGLGLHNKTSSSMQLKFWVNQRNNRTDIDASSNYTQLA